MKTYSLTERISINGSRSLTIEGEITLSNSLFIKEELLEAIGNGNGAHHICAKLTDLDLAGFQVLEALKKSLQEAPEKPTFEITLPKEVAELAYHTGFTF